MHHRSQAFLFAALVLAPHARAQVAETFGAEDTRAPNPSKPAFQPFSAAAGLDLSFLPVLSLPSVDPNALGAQDAFAESGGGVPLRTGIVRQARLRDSDGVWSELDGGRWLWVAEVRAIDALGVRLHFANLDLPRGANATSCAIRRASRARSRAAVRSTRATRGRRRSSASARGSSTWSAANRASSPRCRSR